MSDLPRMLPKTTKPDPTAEQWLEWFRVPENVKQLAQQHMDRLTSVHDAIVRVDDDGNFDEVCIHRGSMSFHLERIDSLWWNLSVSVNGAETVLMNFKSTEFVSQGEVEFGWKANETDIAEQGWADWESD